jgi:hypothetical protein
MVDCCLVGRRWKRGLFVVSCYLFVVFGPLSFSNILHFFDEHYPAKRTQHTQLSGWLLSVCEPTLYQPPATSSQQPPIIIEHYPAKRAQRTQLSGWLLSVWHPRFTHNRNHQHHQLLFSPSPPNYLHFYY